CSADTCCSPLACGTSLTCINRPPPEPPVGCVGIGGLCGEQAGGAVCCPGYQCNPYTAQCT
ncbi:MAG: hypothetical protein ABID61_00505, partial [Candidatus Micrarchaeota archaeon]